MQTAPAHRPALTPPPAATPALSLRIDRLAVQGFAHSARDGARLEQALQAELQRLLATGPSRLDRLSSQAVDRLRLGELRLPRGASPEQLGRLLAVALLAEIAP